MRKEKLMVKIRKLAGKPVRNGFSLLEMLVVVGIILILATVAGPKFMSAGKTAKIAKISADIRTIDNAAALYEIDKGKYPDSVAALAEKDSDGKAYLQFEPKLPDGGTYVISADGVVSGTFDGKTYNSQMQDIKNGGGQ